MPHAVAAVVPKLRISFKLTDREGTTRATYQHKTVVPGEPLYIGRSKQFRSPNWRQRIGAPSGARCFVHPDEGMTALLSSKRAHAVICFVKAGECLGEGGPVSTDGFYLAIYSKRGAGVVPPTNPLWRLVPGGRDWVKLEWSTAAIRLNHRERFCIGGQFHWKVLIDTPPDTSVETTSVTRRAWRRPRPFVHTLSATPGEATRMQSSSPTETTVMF